MVQKSLLSVRNPYPPISASEKILLAEDISTALVEAQNKAQEANKLRAKEAKTALEERVFSIRGVSFPKIK